MQRQDVDQIKLGDDLIDTDVSAAETFALLYARFEEGLGRLIQRGLGALDLKTNSQ
ncbi:MAG: hypothetical protein P8X55_21535 [Desulfosarcinaceae bacterium]